MKYRIDDVVTIVKTGSAGYIREVICAGGDVRYVVSYYKEGEVNKIIPSILFWEHELEPRRKIRTLRNGREILVR